VPTRPALLLHGSALVSRPQVGEVLPRRRLLDNTSIDVQSSLRSGTAFWLAMNVASESRSQYLVEHGTALAV